MATVKSSNVSVEVIQKSVWSTGYDGAFVIRNDNDYDVLGWSLEFTFDDSFTWLSDGDCIRLEGNRYVLRPKDWCRLIKAGSELTLAYGGRMSIPRNVRFIQELPLVGDDPAEKTRGAWSNKAVAPYTDVCAYPTPDLVATANESGLRFFTMAFITAQNGKPAWGGIIPLESQHMLDQVRKIRALGGDVSVSFGGANGVELAQAITSVPDLVAAYSRVIDMYSLTRVDFDIEGAAVAEPASVDRRNKALALLAQKYPKLQMTYCLPVLPTGLTKSGVDLVRNAAHNRVPMYAFHAMSMDYGDSAAPNPEGQMGKYAIQSVENMRVQVVEAGFTDPRIGVIPMIGHNDVLTEYFRLTDAAQVREFFVNTPWMTYVGWWSTNRDRPGPGNGANPFDSGIDQAPWDFAKAFLGSAPGSVTKPSTEPPKKPGRTDTRLEPDIPKLEAKVRRKVMHENEPLPAVLAKLRAKYRLTPEDLRRLRKAAGTR